jgi:hypothetical protein
MKLASCHGVRKPCYHKQGIDSVTKRRGTVFAKRRSEDALLQV